MIFIQGYYKSSYFYQFYSFPHFYLFPNFYLFYLFHLKMWQKKRKNCQNMQKFETRFYISMMLNKSIIQCSLVGITTSSQKSTGRQEVILDGTFSMFVVIN